MLDILILYSLNKREQTFYGLAKNIAEQFGEISMPSHGALHPALKRLMEDNLLCIRKKISDGGKRYTYYTVSKDFQKGFDEKFMQFNYAKTETLESFLCDLKIRLMTLDMLSPQFKEEFREKSLLKLDNFEQNINIKLKNEYIELNPMQRKISEQYLKEILEYKNILLNY